MALSQEQIKRIRSLMKGRAPTRIAETMQQSILSPTATEGPAVQRYQPKRYVAPRPKWQQTLAMQPRGGMFREGIRRGFTEEELTPYRAGERKIPLREKAIAPVKSWAEVADLFTSTVGRGYKKMTSTVLKKIGKPKLAKRYEEQFEKNLKSLRKFAKPKSPAEAQAMIEYETSELIATGGIGGTKQIGKRVSRILKKAVEKRATPKTIGKIIKETEATFKPISKISRVPKKAQPLIKKARTYKTAEEFVESSIKKDYTSEIRAAEPITLEKKMQAAKSDQKIFDMSKGKPIKQLQKEIADAEKFAAENNIPFLRSAQIKKEIIEQKTKLLDIWKQAKEIKKVKPEKAKPITKWIKGAKGRFIGRRPVKKVTPVKKTKTQLLKEQQETAAQAKDEVREKVIFGLNKKIKTLEVEVKEAKTPLIYEKKIKDLEFSKGLIDSVKKNREPMYDLLNTADRLRRGRYVKDEAFGGIAGIEIDEEGKIKFDPKKTVLGMAGVGVAKKLPKKEITKLAYKTKFFGRKIDVTKLPKEYQEITKVKKLSKIKDLLVETKKGLAKGLAPISTQLEKIHPGLKIAIRKFEYNINTKKLRNTKAVIPLLKSVRKMGKQERAIFDLAAKNGDVKILNALAESHGFRNELKVVRKVLDDIHARAIKVDVDIGYIKNYFPRTISNPKGFLNHLGKGDDWSIIDEALKARAKALGMRATDLEPEEQAQIINNLLRGYGDKISLAKIRNLKERKIKVLNQELNQFYAPFESSLVRYIDSVNDMIESKRFFGKGIPKDTNIEDSIAMYVIKAVSKGKIKPSQEKELTSILKARFNQKRINSFVRVYKNLEYIDTMGSPISAITQIGDLAFSAYRNGYFRTGKSLLRAMFRRSKISREDIGIEKIAQEFVDGSKTGKLVDEVFKMTGLNYIDRLGKESLINSSFDKYVKLAKRKDKNFAKQLLKVFNKKEAKQVIKDFEAGRKTENVKLMLFNDLLDVQPVALSEMPEIYLSRPNSRIFYMLKTYQIKVLDIYRREVFQTMKKEPIKGLKNLIKLGAALMVFNITADKIKDFMLGRETDFGDTLVDNMLRTAGFSKYDVWKAREEGIATAIKKKILPPSKIFDSVYKDIIKGVDTGTEAVASIPLFGKLYYWWFGKGAIKTAKKKERVRKKKIKRKVKIKKKMVKKKQVKKRIKRQQD